MTRIALGCLLVMGTLVAGCGSGDDNAQGGGNPPSKVFPQDYPAQQDGACPTIPPVPADWGFFSCQAWLATHDKSGNQIPAAVCGGELTTAECKELNDTAVDKGVITPAARDWNMHWKWCPLISPTSAKLLVICPATQ
ncbi:MAG TPA: hypothetical protein VNO21_25620 [Polyangiaceae bacterium]|nr:hypothetical protein [Polyangiaceae bacterium]